MKTGVLTLSMVALGSSNAMAQTANDSALKGDERKLFMSHCLKGRKSLLAC